ncbi:MAG: hypothetical protein OXC31_16490 [Spirochaetaceae bacterium]|nr:hypothetical protein [Spirochaetaceae bacterium]
MTETTTTVTLAGKEIDLKLGDEWRRRYAAVTAGGYSLRARSLNAAIREAKRYAGGDGPLARLVAVAVYETRVLDGQPNGIYTEYYCPKIDEGAAELTRNLRVVG